MQIMSAMRFPFDKLLIAVLPVVACSYVGNLVTQPNIQIGRAHV